QQVPVDAAVRRRLLEELEPGDDPPRVTAEQVARVLIAQVHHQLLEIRSAEDFAFEERRALLGDLVHFFSLPRTAISATSFSSTATRVPRSSGTPLAIAGRASVLNARNGPMFAFSTSESRSACSSFLSVLRF